jgi:hypothetical protein
MQAAMGGASFENFLATMHPETLNVSAREQKRMERAIRKALAAPASGTVGVKVYTSLNAPATYTNAATTAGR